MTRGRRGIRQARGNQSSAPPGVDVEIGELSIVGIPSLTDRDGAGIAAALRDELARRLAEPSSAFPVHSHAERIDGGEIPLVGRPARAVAADLAGVVHRSVLR